MRRDWIPSTLALVLVPATVALVLDRMPDSSRSELIIRKPTHRVAVAVFEALKAELASVDRSEGEYSQDDGPEKSDKSAPEMGKLRIPEDYPSFWFVPRRFSPKIEIRPETSPYGWNDESRNISTSIASIVVDNKPTLAILNTIDLDGTARDGRAVKVTVRLYPIGSGSVVDFHGDEALARALSGKIADRLAHPVHEHESPEDRAALIAFFGSQPPGSPVGPPAPPAGIILGNGAR